MNTTEIKPESVYLNNDERLGDRVEVAGFDIIAVVKMYEMEGEEIDVKRVCDGWVCDCCKGIKHEEDEYEEKGGGYICEDCATK